MPRSDSQTCSLTLRILSGDATGTLGGLAVGWRLRVGLTDSAFAAELGRRAWRKRAKDGDATDGEGNESTS